MKSFLFFLILFSRGLMQLGMPRNVALAVQLLAVTVTLSYLWLARGALFRRSQGPLLLTALAFLGIAVLSSAVTLAVQQDASWAVYLSFNAILLFWGIVGTSLAEQSIVQGSFWRAALYVGWLLIAAAIAEQVYLLTLPGCSRFGFIVRPASLTASYLHYPLIMALLAVIAYQAYRSTQSVFARISAIAFAMAPLLALSRSGLLVLVGTALLVWASQLSVRQLVKFGALALALGMLACFSLSERLLLVVDASTRLRVWGLAVDLWLNSNLLVGEYTGMATNAAADRLIVAESGPLQQLLNFGLLGMLAFYAFLIQVAAWIRSEHRWLRAGYFAALIESIFYQSIEVLPFMALLLLFPAFSACLSEAVVASPQDAPVRQAACHR